MATIESLKNELEVHKTESAKKIEKLESEIMWSTKVKITFYAPALKGINSDSRPDLTATMEKPIPGWTCAISRDLVKAGWLGRRIYIPGLGIRYASDIMGKSVRGKAITKQIDICVGQRHVWTESKKFGKTHEIATILERKP
jgi:hypothetical protein